MITVELSKFRVKKGKSEKVDEWLNFLNENMEDTLLTLLQEKMYVETIFREFSDGEEYLYWYSIQGEGGQQVEDSESYIDKTHLKYWHECIDPSYPPMDLKPSVLMIPEFVRTAMK